MTDPLSASSFGSAIEARSLRRAGFCRFPLTGTLSASSGLDLWSRLKRVVARQYAPPRLVGGLLRSLGKAARPKRPRFTPGALCFARLVSCSRAPAPDRNSPKSRSGLVGRRPSPHRPCRPDDARRAVETSTCPAPAPPRPTHSQCGRSCRTRPGLCRHRPMWRSAARSGLQRIDVIGAGDAHAVIGPRLHERPTLLDGGTPTIGALDGRTDLMG